jgi:hypothetical protein
MKEAMRLISVAVLFATMTPALARGGSIFESNHFLNTIGEYTTDGGTVNPALISGLSGPAGLAASDGYIYVTNMSNGTVGKYTTTGQTVNAALISGLTQPAGVVVSGDVLYVLSGTSAVVGMYSTAGDTLNAALIKPQGSAEGIAIQGNNLFVDNNDGITEYTTSGAMVARLATGFEQPVGIAVLGSTIYVAGIVDDTVRAYTTSGNIVNRSLIAPFGIPIGVTAYDGNIYITDLILSAGFSRIEEYTPSGQGIAVPLVNLPDGSYGIAIVPEPSSAVLLGFGALAFIGWARFRSRQAREPR